MQWLNRACSVRPAMGEKDKTAIITVKSRDRLITTLIEKHEKI